MPFFIETTTPKGFHHNPYLKTKDVFPYQTSYKSISAFFIAFFEIFADIIEKVKEIKTEPFRPDQPKLIDNDANPEILKLMEKCWEEDPAARPDISHVLKQLKVINRGRYVQINGSLEKPISVHLSVINLNEQNSLCIFNMLFVANSILWII